MQLTRLFAATSLALPHFVAAVTCKKGAHIVVARASFEPQGEGIIGTVAENITKAIPDSDSVAVVYPATFLNPDYKTSEEEGVGNMTMLIKEYGDACPDGKMVLMGYSQGAQVVGDTLIGADESLFNDDTDPMATPLATKYLDQIVAIIMMGDPAHVNTTKFNVGNATNNGYFPRNNSASFDTLGLTPKMQSYCNSNDTYCDNGSSSLVHASYTFVYGAAATKFVVDKVQTALNGTSESGSTLRSSSATSTAAPGGSSETATSSIAEATGTGSTASSSGGAIAPASGEASSVAKGAMGYLMTGVLSSAFVIALYL